MLADLPTACDVGSKKNSKGYKETWIGYKLHLDVACGQIPVSCVLTSASVHDSQVAIPLMTMTGARVPYLYDLMDAAYDAAAIHDHSKALGHAPIIDRNFRAQHEAKAEWAKEVERMKLIHMPDPDDGLFDFRTMAERVNARLKDEFGARFVRVRGAIKVKCHLMFGVVALAVDQILRVTQLQARAGLSPGRSAQRTQRKFPALSEFCKRLGGLGFRGSSASRWSKASPRAGSKHSWIPSPLWRSTGSEFIGTPDDSPGIRLRSRR